MMSQIDEKMTRRRFLGKMTAGGLLTLVPGIAARADDRLFLRVRVSFPMSFGLITDTHYGDLNDNDRPRFFRAALDNIGKTAEMFKHERVDFAIHMGDVIQESKNRELSLHWLGEADERFRNFEGDRHYVMGNHDLGDLSKDDFLSATSGKIQAANYFFDHKGYRFIAIDANFRSDGVAYNRGNFSWADTIVPPTQLAWLSGVLEGARESDLRVMVFSHQCFDPTSSDHQINNAAEVRQLFENSGNVDAVFYGHRHAGGYFNINGIHYVGMVATVNGPDMAAAVVRIRSDGWIEIDGRGNRQRDWGPLVVHADT